MPTLKFTQSQRAILIPLLEHRIELMKSNKMQEKDILRYIDALDRIHDDKEIDAKPHKTTIMSCTNPYLKKLFQNLRKDFSWLNISEQQREWLEHVDCCRDILVMCGEKEHKDENTGLPFKYSDYFGILESIRNSQFVYLSHINTNVVYKVTFVFDNGIYVSCKLDRHPKWDNFQEFPWTKKGYFFNHEHSLKTKKSEAKRILEGPNIVSSSDEMFQFVNQLLG